MCLGLVTCLCLYAPSSEKGQPPPFMYDLPMKAVVP